MSSKTSKNRRIGNGNAHVCALPRASLDFCSANRATTLHSQNKMDKNSNRNSVQVLAWCLACKARKRINELSFKAFLYTVCACSKTELESQRRREYERRAGALVCVVQATAPCCWPRLAHKAQWHGFQPICITNTPYAVRCLQRTSDCYEVNRVSVSPANDE